MVFCVSVFNSYSFAGSSSNNGLPRGQIMNPVASPSNPDIVAFTKYSENTERLYFYHVVTGQLLAVSDDNVARAGEEDEVLSFFQAHDSEVQLPRFYEGDFNWRPVLDQFGRQWFTFVSSREGDLQLALGYLVDEDDLDVMVYYIKHGESVFSPVFSPDGRKLVFVSNAQLYLETDIRKVLDFRRIDSFQPVLITEHESGSFFPSWSHDSKLIAYQAKSASGEREGRETIYLVDLNELNRNKGEVLKPHEISPQARTRVHDHVLPAWALDRRVLAYYEMRESYDGLDTERVIRVNEIGYNHQDDRYFTRDLPGARSVIFARNVYPTRRTGPNWVLFELGGVTVNGILWVSRDPNLRDPIYLTDLSAFQRQRAGEPNRAIVTLEEDRDALINPPTINNRFPSLLQSTGHLRTLHVSQVHDTNQLQINDVPVRNINKTIPADVNEGDFLLRSAIFPGYGYYSMGNRKRAFIVSGVFAGSAAATLSSVIIRYQKSTAVPSNNTIVSLSALTAAIWAGSLYDATRFLPAKRSVPVMSTLHGYRPDIDTPSHSRMKFIMEEPNRKTALLLTGLFPGAGHLYAGEINRGFLLGGSFGLLAGSTVLGTGARYFTAAERPGNRTLYATGALAAGIWAYSFYDVYRSSLFRQNRDVTSRNAISEVRMQPFLEQIDDRAVMTVGLSVAF